MSSFFSAAVVICAGVAVRGPPLANLRLTLVGSKGRSAATYGDVLPVDLTLWAFLSAGGALIVVLVLLLCRVQSL